MRRAVWVSMVPLALVLAVGCLVVQPLGDYEGPATTSGSGGDAGTGGTSSGGSGGSAVSSGGSGGNSGMGGSQATTSTSSAGAAGAPGCSSNAECIADANGQPYRCMPDGSCQRLEHTACPLVVDGDGDEVTDHDNPIYVGAMIPLNLGKAQESPALYPLLVALEELSGEARGGLRLSGDDAIRPLVMVVCSTNDEASVSNGAQHLIETLGVQTIVASLAPNDLRDLFYKYQKNDVFWISPIGATDTLGSELTDEDRVWTLLGQPRGLVPAYQALITDLVEPHVRSVRGVGTERPVRLALLTAKDAFSDELGKLLEPKLVWNGKNVADNRSNGDYESYTLDDQASIAAATTAIGNFVPDIIVSTAGLQVTRADSGLLDSLERGWSGFAGQNNEDNFPRPFWVLSPFNAGDMDTLVSQLNLQVQGKFAPLERMVGITTAGAEDLTLDDAFRTVLGNDYEAANPETGNYYDAFYYMTYAIYAAGVSEPGGVDVGRGMRRLLAGEPFNVGYAHIKSIFDALSDPNATIQLNGTTGPPDFQEDGIRIDPGGVFCFEGLEVGGVYPRRRALRFDSETGSFGAPTGSFPCFNDFWPRP